MPLPLPHQVSAPGSSDDESDGRTGSSSCSSDEEPTSGINSEEDRRLRRWVPRSHHCLLSQPRSTCTRCARTRSCSPMHPVPPPTPAMFAVVLAYPAHPLSCLRWRGTLTWMGSRRSLRTTRRIRSSVTKRCAACLGCGGCLMFRATADAPSSPYHLATP